MKTDIDKVIAQIVEKFLPRFSGENIGLLFSIELRFSHYGKTQETAKNINVNILFQRPANYTRVLAMINQNKFVCNDIFDMTEESYHDSCWRSDGFSFLRMLIQKEKENFENEIKSQKYSFDVCLGFVPFEFVEINKISPVSSEAYEKRMKVNVGKCLNLNDAMLIILKEIKS
jgi:hypothetical protein